MVWRLVGLAIGGVAAYQIVNKAKGAYAKAECPHCGSNVGVFFPLEQLPAFVRGAASILPLGHAINAVRPLLLQGEVPLLWLHVLVLLTYTVVGFGIARALMRRRLLS